MTQTQAVIGTAQYLSPEQARGETVDARSDLYSAGCLLFELVTGRPPFVADSPVAVAYQHVREQPPVPSSLNPAVPEDVDRIILHSLAKDRETRYQTAHDFRADIDAVRSGRPVEATVPVGAVDPNAATQYLGAAGGSTRAMPPVNGGGGPAAPLLPGLPPVNEDEEAPYPARRERREEPKRNRGLVYVLVGLAVLLAFGALAFATSTFFRAPDAPKKVGVPGVVNLTREAAEAKLKASGFNVSVQTAANNAKEGTVVDQDPDAEQLLAPGGTVTITVSAGPKTVRVPQILGLTQEDARKALEDAGLRVGTVRAEDVKGKANTITRSEPEVGATVAEGREVNLFYASGNVPVPRLFGNDIADAQQQLQELGLTYDIQDRAISSIEPGKAAGTNPAAGTLVQVGKKVILYQAVAPPEPSPSISPSVSESPSPSPSPSPSEE
jgi:serine/threonine-protein kinase